MAHLLTEKKNSSNSHGSSINSKITSVFAWYSFFKRQNSKKKVFKNELDSKAEWCHRIKWIFFFCFVFLLNNKKYNHRQKPIFFFKYPEKHTGKVSNFLDNKFLDQFNIQLSFFYNYYCYFITITQKSHFYFLLVRVLPIVKHLLSC